MQILEIKILRGPNYWSTYRKQLIQMKLDIGEFEKSPTDQLPGFPERLAKLLPGMYKHECSEKKPGGFFERVGQGTWLGHVVEHVALELQTLAGMDCGYGRTRSTSKKGVYHVVFAYELEKAGIYAAKAAVRIVEDLANNISCDIGEDIEKLTHIKKRDGLGPSTMAIIEEAKKRDIPWRRLDDNSLILLGHGINQRLVRATIAGTTSALGVDFAGDKETTKQLLEKESIPVPKIVTVVYEDEIDEAIEEIGYPVVIKPVNGNHGRGITTNICNREDAVKAFRLAKEISRRVIMETHLKGYDFRFLLINYKLVAAAKRIPPFICGNGHSTIAELIEELNRDPRRGDGHENVMTTIKIDEATNLILQKNKLTLESVLESGQSLMLKGTANMSTGGTSRDVTSLVHPYNVFIAERAARLLNLDICGIDLIAEDITIPFNQQKAGMLEVNAAPGLRMHLAPAEGQSRNVAAPLIEMLYPNYSPARIPVIAVTGTNGKTTTTRLLAYIMRLAGHTVGYCTTDGVYIGDQQLEEGDCTGPRSAEKILRDPMVDMAVLECARGGILRSGLGFDKCSTSIITNISDDHLGLGDIESIEDLAKVKAVVANSTLDDGYAVLNADDDLVFNMRKELDCNIVLFSLNDNNERIRDHCINGGIAVYISNDHFIICRDGHEIRVAKVSDTPLTLAGTATSMIKNILAALGAAVANNIQYDLLRKALVQFLPGPELTPGRMNIFRFSRFKLMVDYAHNRDGLVQLKNFLDSIVATTKIGIITSPGDRRDEDIINIGIYAARMFDEIIIRHDVDTRGRERDEITKLITKGIRQVNAYMPVAVVSGETDSIQYAMNTATEGAFIVACVDDVKKCIEYVSNAKEFEDSFLLNQIA